MDNSQRSTKVSAATTSVLIKRVPQKKYQQFRGQLLDKHGLSVSLWFRMILSGEIIWTKK